MFPVGKHGLIRVGGSASRISNNYDPIVPGGGGLVAHPHREQADLGIAFGNFAQPRLVPEYADFYTFGETTDSTFISIERSG